MRRPFQSVGGRFLFVVFFLFITANQLHAQWIQTNGPYGGLVPAFAVSGTNLFAGTSGGGVFLSTNSGTSWTARSTGLTTTLVNALVISGTNLFAGIWGGGVFLSTNNGTSWTAGSTGLTDTYVTALAVSGTNFFVGTYGGGVFLSTNSGTSWNAVNTGLPAEVDAFVVAPTGSGSGASLFAGTRYLGVYRRPLSEMTSVEDAQSILPSTSLLGQNYPNPFNPSTIIKYQLRAQSYVTLRVFDLLGREVATLVEGIETPGNKSVQWDAGRVACGVYFYRLDAGSFTSVKKLLLLK